MIRLFIVVLAVTPVKPPTQSLLDGRLEATLPVGMKIEPRTPSLMSAEASHAEETRGVLDENGTRFVMLVQELFARAGTNVKTELEKQGSAPALIQGAQVIAYGAAVTPTEKHDANLVYQAWTVLDDGSMQRFDFYVAPKGIPDASRWATRASQIVASVRSGGKALRLDGGQTRISQGNEALELTLPAGWVITAQQGPDFEVYHLWTMVDFGARATECGVYLGGYSREHWREANPKMSQSSGTLLGQKTTWTTWQNHGAPFVETMVNHPKSDHLKLHVWCGSTSSSALTTARSVLETLR